MPGGAWRCLEVPGGAWRCLEVPGAAEIWYVVRTWYGSGRGMTVLRVTPFSFFTIKTNTFLRKETKGVTRNTVYPAKLGGARD